MVGHGCSRSLTDRSLLSIQLIFLISWLHWGQKLFLRHRSIRQPLWNSWPQGLARARSRPASFTPHNRQRKDPPAAALDNISLRGLVTVKTSPCWQRMRRISERHPSCGHMASERVWFNKHLRWNSWSQLLGFARSPSPLWLQMPHLKSSLIWCRTAARANLAAKSFTGIPPVTSSSEEEEESFRMLMSIRVCLSSLQTICLNDFESIGHLQLLKASSVRHERWKKWFGQHSGRASFPTSFSSQIKQFSAISPLNTLTGSYSIYLSAI